MSIACPLPDGDLGVAIRLSRYLGCQAQALGENGFQALAGGPIVTGLLSGLTTIFIALIGYRIMLGAMPDVPDGVGRAVRLGFVFALATGWPAFQTLIYDVVIEAPGEIAGVLLPATNLPSEGIEPRVQLAYDTIRLGSGGLQAPEPQDMAAGTSPPAPGVTQAPPPPSAAFGQAALPETASWFVISTLGVVGALKIVAGLLLALGPIAVMALLFDATLGLFSGWLRALAGSAIGVLFATIVTGLDLMLVESELVRMQAIERGASMIDPRGLTTIVLALGLVMLVAIWGAARMTGAIRLPLGNIAHRPFLRNDGERQFADMPAAAHRADAPIARVAPPGLSRAQGTADALVTAVRREQGRGGQDSGAGITAARATAAGLSPRSGDAVGSGPVPVNVARRSTGRRTRSAARRDGSA